MDDDARLQALLQAFARMQVHEFALELMMANWIAAMPAEEGDRLLDDFTGRFRTAAWTELEPSVDDQTQFHVLQEAGNLAERFAKKVRRRASEIRAQHRSQMGPDSGAPQ